MSKEELEILVSMLETAKTQKNCDRCGKPLGNKVCIRLTRVVHYKETICERCGIERDRNTEAITNALLEVTDKLLGGLDE